MHTPHREQKRTTTTTQERRDLCRSHYKTKHTQERQPPPSVYPTPDPKKQPTRVFVIDRTHPVYFLAAAAPLFFFYTFSLFALLSSPPPFLSQAPLSDLETPQTRMLRGRLFCRSVCERLETSSRNYLVTSGKKNRIMRGSEKRKMKRNIKGCLNRRSRCETAIVSF